MMEALMRIQAIMLSLLALLWLSGTLVAAGQQDTFEIVGILRDAQGHGMADASVRLQPQGEQRAERHITDAAGRFQFSGLKPGLYVLSASTGEKHSNDVSVKGMGGATQRVELTLTEESKAAAGGSQSTSGKAADMEFSDVPNFTVAAVTDWTAAGGHGSDAVLRTSEALTRDTLHLKPDLKSNATTQHDISEREQRLREAVQKAPGDVNANEELGRFYLNGEQYAQAVAPLQASYESDHANADNEYALALALARSGNARKAREHLARLLSKRDEPDWQRLSGEVDEKLGDPLGAVRAFERAVKGDPSEENYFAWGTELLQHRAIWQAKDVFEAGVKTHPHSVRLLTALGTALFSAALYDDAAQALCQASDLDSKDVEPYLFMGEVEIASPNPLPCIETKLERFEQQEPTNALANYYYAMAYWKQHGKSSDAETMGRVETLLTKAVEDDPKCSSAYLQLGVIQASQSNFQQASEFYRKAIDADSQSTEAHFRLGVAYDRLGEKDKAAEEFKLHDELEKQKAAAVDRQRRDVKQFLVLVGGSEHDKAAKP
jgi:tetratricopeptide (TPR) repeat protein